MQRSSSGSRNGVNAMVHTLKSMNSLTRKNRTKKQFESFFSDEFYKDYPDANTAEIDARFANNIDWGKGQQLGRTPTELMQTANLPNVIKSFEERRANIAKSKLLSVAAPAVPVAPAIPVVAPAPVVPASVPAKAAPKAVPAPAPPPPPTPAPKKAPPPPPEPVAPAKTAPPPPTPNTSPKKTDDTRDYKPVKYQGLTADENSNAKVHVKMAHVQITKSDIEKELERQNNRRFGFQHNKIRYNTHWGSQAGKISAELI